MKFPPRKQQHPEVLSSGTHSSVLYAALREHFADTELRSSGQIQGYLNMLSERMRVGPFDTAQGGLCFAVLAWQDNGRPVYFLEEGLAETLVHTEVPMDVFDLPIWLPDDGMYVALPPVVLD